MIFFLKIYRKIPKYLKWHLFGSKIVFSIKNFWLKLLIKDWGFEYGIKADRNKVVALSKKLGMTENDTGLEEW